MKKIMEKLALAVLTVGLAAAPALANNGPRSLNDEVRHQLLTLPYYTVFDNLNYRVDGTTVYLSGSVRAPFMRSDAEAAVQHIAGVGKVVNNIEVQPVSGFDNRIRIAEYRAIYGYGGMYRYALGTNPSIRIIVDNGHVRLVGVVDSQTDKNIAGIRANSVPGVFSVQNDLRVGS